MDLVKDSEVTTLANYADTKVDYLDGATAIKYAEAVIKIYGGVTQEMIDGGTEAYPDPMTNEEKALRYIDAVRQYHKRCLKAAAVPVAVETYRETQTATVEAEGDTDFGDDEYVPPEEEDSP